MCNPGSFYVNNEEINLPTARSTEGRCELTNNFVPPILVHGVQVHPGNPTGKKWAPWSHETASIITDLTFFAHMNEIYPYTPEMCQQLCEQARTGGIKNVGNSFSTTGLNKISLLSPNSEYPGIYYQCMCGVTKGNCVLNTLLPTGDRYPDEDKWQTYDWTATAINKCTKCK